MLVLEDLISKMKIHFPRWMDIRRKIKTSSGGQLLCSIAEEISEIQTGATGSLKTANGSATTKPSSNYQFGGFGAGTSRNGNAVPNSTSYNYVQETIAENTKQSFAPDNV